MLIGQAVNTKGTFITEHKTLGKVYNGDFKSVNEGNTEIQSQ